jgi:hypothetical protein
VDARRFDSLARSMARPTSRRGLFGSVAALAAGALGLRGADAQVSQVYCGNQLCASNPSGCKPGCVCCLYTNPITKTVINSRCRPPGTCSPGVEAGGSATTTTPAPTTTTPQCVTAATCPIPSNACTVATCTNGLCGFADKSNGDPCDDGNPCTSGDVCTSGVCAGAPYTCTPGECQATSVCDGAGGCTTTASEDGTACPGGVCDDGVCCNTGPGLPGSDVCDPQFGGACCLDGAICCGADGCCTDCFLEREFGDGLCCPESSLCPPRSSSNPEPPYCCRAGSEVCAPDGSSVGANCYIEERVCNGRYCDGECCGGTACCEAGTYCSGGGCVPVPSLPNGCLEDADCGPGLGCVGVVRALVTPEGGGEPTIIIDPGFCCPLAQVCDSQLDPDEYNTPDSICCSAGQRCEGPFLCCELEGCSPRGGRTRL